MTTARAIFFDAADTLFRVKGSVGAIYADVARRYGSLVGPDRVERAFHEVFSAAPPLAFPDAVPGTIRRLEKEWWRDVVRGVFHRVGMIQRFDEYFEELFRFFAGARGWELFPETAEVLRKLRATGFVLGTITNFDSRIYTVLSELRIFDSLDSVTHSSREGAAKPHPKIFAKALMEHDLIPAQAIHVGNSLSEDVEGARASGMTPVYLSRDGSAGPEGILTIRSLGELLTRVSFDD
jgi:putative hydrolase of the HAD superfamily